MSKSLTPSLYATCRRFAARQAGRLQASVEPDVLDSAAGLGLAQALQRHQPGRAALTTYAWHCIRGQVTQAIRDGIAWQRLPRAEAPRDPEPPHTPDREAQLSVRRQLARLPRAQRRAVWLRHVEGYSVSEIADLQGRHRASVHRDLARGLQRLRAGLSDP